MFDVIILNKENYYIAHFYQFGFYYVLDKSVYNNYNEIYDFCKKIIKLHLDSIIFNKDTINISYFKINIGFTSFINKIRNNKIKDNKINNIKINLHLQ